MIYKLDEEENKACEQERQLFLTALSLAAEREFEEFNEFLGTCSAEFLIDMAPEIVFKTYVAGILMDAPDELLPDFADAYTPNLVPDAPLEMLYQNYISEHDGSIMDTEMLTDDLNDIIVGEILWETTRK